MRILYGGAFNPPTLAHFKIVKYLTNKYPNSELILLPTNNYYFKKELVPITDRIKMLELLCNEIDSKHIIVSDYEAHLNEYQGTYYILQAFNNPYFVIGADSLAKIDKWIKFPNIIIENKFIVFPRSGYNIEDTINKNEILKAHSDNFVIASDFKKINISSSLFRRSSDNKYLLKSIDEYIKKNKLYEVN